MKKIISFTLYQGVNTPNVYFYGVMCNIELAKIIYPGWVCRIYHGESVPDDIIQKISEYDNVELYPMTQDEVYSYRMWRFLPIDDDDVEIMLCRDADSRLSYRERKLVDIFLESDYLMHSIQDNRNHPDVMAGMWGLKKNDRINMSNLCKEFKKTIGPHTDYGYNSDQDFLRNIIKPIYQDSILTHCSFNLKNMPIDPDVNGYFVGQTFTFGDNNGLPLNHIFY